VYEAKGRRDPFRPLITPRVPATTAKVRPKTGLASLEVHELKLAGIVWEPRGFYALVEAPNGAGYVLRVNDIIGEEARVAKITAEAVTVEVKRTATPVPSATAVTRLVELRLRKEE
jgi:Tfp pilus assembly protein PilP